MKKIVIFIVFTLAMVALWGFNTTEANSANNSDANEYRTEVASHGDISNTISATGTLAAVDDVVVGAQLSGLVTQVLVDFNDSVSQGQLLAKIDPRTFAAQVDQATANRDKAAADIQLQRISIDQAKVHLAQAKRDLKRAQGLAKDGSISEDELDDIQTEVEFKQLELAAAKSQLQVLISTLAANNASLEQAEIQLERTNIRAPIDGFVIDRIIEPGQTVASSYNTPELFTLAKDLTQMEIEAYIDESDIGQIAQEQRVNFNVDAYPERTFHGRIEQIRKAPQTDSGVVSYTVVIAASNRNGLLLPGMTANLEVNIDAVRNVQRLSNATIRTAQSFTKANQAKERTKGGPRGVLAQLNLSDEQQQQLREMLPKSSGDAGGRRGQDQQRQKMESALNKVLTPEQLKMRERIRSGQLKLATVLVLHDGEPQPLTVELGISDDQFTEIQSPDLSAYQIVSQIKAKR